MASEEDRFRKLTHDFFRTYPDYPFCRTLAANIIDQVTTYESATAILAKKVQAAEQNRQQIDEKLDHYRVQINGQPVRVRDLSLGEIVRQEDHVLQEITAFYFKHPYAHGRTKKSRLLPQWIRTFSLRVLLGHARKRELELDYEACFDMLRLL